VRRGPPKPTPPLPEIRRYYHAALEFADLAQRVVRAGLARGLTRRRKPDLSLVTNVDLTVERALRRAIASRFPNHGIAGEEFPPSHPGAPWQWIIDPIDGTLGLSHGLPLYGTILGLWFHGQALVGVIDHPELGTRYSAARGLGAFRNGIRFRLKDVPRGGLADEIVSAADRTRFRQCGKAGAFDLLLRRHRQVRGYYDCIAHSWAAEGSIGAVVDFGVRLWDIAATQVLVEEAGGSYLLASQRGQGSEGVYGIIAGKPRTVRWLRRLFRV
jgi:fructose-1,6-bisphosphatase/inositol monophosphatase family enzyme